MVKIVIRKFALEALLKRAGCFVERVSTIPILEAVKLSVGADGFAVEGTNLDHHVRIVATECDVAGEDAVCVRLAPLLAFVRECDPAVPLVIEWAADAAEAGTRPMMIWISSGPVAARFFAMNAEDFPGWPAVEPIAAFEMPAKDLLPLLTRPRFAMSFQVSRYYLRGIFIHIEGGYLHAVATDGHWMCVEREFLPGNPADMAGVILSRDFVRKAEVLFKPFGDTPVRVAVCDKRVVFSVGHVSISTRLIDGPYPDYKRVIPNAPAAVVTIARRHLLAAVRRAAVLVRQVSPYLGIEVRSGKLHVSAKDPDIGEVSEALPVQCDGECGQIGFNARYLMEALRAHASEEIGLELKGAGDPVRIQSGPDSFVIQMPARL